MNGQDNGNPLISVVVPVYKVEKFIHECVDSVIAQTYKNLEIILVDDGSPDSCPAICDEYAEKDGRIKVIHQQNGGLSAARNSGIKIARGSYVSFIDSDDCIQPIYIEQLYNMITECGTMISACRHSETMDGLDSELKTDYKIFTNEEAIANTLSPHGYLTTACCKLYKKEIFDDIKFPEGILYEDYSVMPMIFDRAGKIAYADTRLYFYRTNNESITNSYFNESHMTYFDVAKGVNAYLEVNHPDLLVDAHNRDTNMAFAYFRKIVRSGYKNPEVENTLRSVIRGGLKNYLKSGNPLYKKITAVLIVFWPAAAKLILKH